MKTATKTATKKEAEMEGQQRNEQQRNRATFWTITGQLWRLLLAAIILFRRLGKGERKGARYSVCHFCIDMGGTGRPLVHASLPAAVATNRARVYFHLWTVAFWIRALCIVGMCKVFWRKGDCRAFIFIGFFLRDACTWSAAVQGAHIEGRKGRLCLNLVVGPVFFFFF